MLAKDAKGRLALWFLSVAVTLGVAIPAGLRLSDPMRVPDARHYLNLADGEPVMLPFASRQLEPLLVRVVSGVLHCPPETSFVLLGVLALAFFAGTVATLIVRLRQPRAATLWMLCATLPLFFWAHQFNGLFLPDLFYSALVCGLLLLLWRGHLFWAAAMLFPLAVARESTILLLVCLLIAGWRSFDWRHKAVAMGATVAGLLLVKHLTANALGNQEHISPALYLAAKMPWNFLRNFLGLAPWANVYPSCAAPVWQHAVHLGPLRAVGSCGFEPWLPIRLAAYALASFGLLPLLLWRNRAGWRQADLLVRFALLYGVVSYCIAGLLGDSVERLFGYAWPAFLVALPALALPFRSRTLGYLFLALHLGLSWAALWLRGGALLGVGLLAYAAGVFLLRE